MEYKKNIAIKNSIWAKENVRPGSLLVVKKELLGAEAFFLIEDDLICTSTTDPLLKKGTSILTLEEKVISHVWIRKSYFSEHDVVKNIKSHTMVRVELLLMGLKFLYKTDIIFIPYEPTMFRNILFEEIFEVKNG